MTMQVTRKRTAYVIEGYGTLSNCLDIDCTVKYMKIDDKKVMTETCETQYYNIENSDEYQNYLAGYGDLNDYFMENNGGENDPKVYPEYQSKISNDPRDHFTFNMEEE